MTDGQTRIKLADDAAISQQLKAAIVPLLEEGRSLKILAPYHLPSIVVAWCVVTAS